MVSEKWKVGLKREFPFLKYPPQPYPCECGRDIWDFCHADPAQSKTCHKQMVLWSMKGSTETEDGVKFLRLLLAQAGVQYEDKRISQAEWEAKKPCK